MACCDLANGYDTREGAMVVIRQGNKAAGIKGVWCDPCLAPLITALNDGGLPTVASCCGHGENPGSVALADGRWLLILPDHAAYDAAEALLRVHPRKVTGIRQDRYVSKLPPSVTIDEIDEQRAKGWPEPFGGQPCCEVCFARLIGDESDDPEPWRCGTP